MGESRCGGGPASGRPFRLSDVSESSAPAEPQPPEKDTVAMYFVRAALTHVPNSARADLLTQAGIAPELCSIDHARVPAPAFAALWLAVARALDDEFFGLDPRRMKVGSFALLCQAVLHTDSLAHALRRFVRGLGLMLDAVQVRLLTGSALPAGGPVSARASGVVCLDIDNAIADAGGRRFADETVLILIHGVLCWLSGQRIPLLRVDFAHPLPAHAAEYTVMYAQHVTFASLRTRVWFDEAWLRLPVVQTDDSLRAFLAHAPQSVFLKFKNPDGWAPRLRRRLRHSIESTHWPAFEDIAREWGIAPSTLRRRLEAEGASFQDVKDALRRDAAIDQLCHTRRPVADIAVQLGFQEPSAFHRAFKRWTGAQPGEYRLQRLRPLDIDPSVKGREA